MTHASTPSGRDDAPLPPGLAARLRALRQDIAPARDPWPAIAARLQAPAQAVPAPAPGPAAAAPGAPLATDRPPAARRDWRRHLRRRNAGYATAAAVVMAVAVGWQLLPVRTVSGPGVDPTEVAATGAAADADVPLLRSADALAREYQAALHEVQAARSGVHAADSATAASAAPPAHGLDAELERSAAEVRAALARDPGAVHLFHQLQRIYAHRLALNLRQA